VIKNMPRQKKTTAKSAMTRTKRVTKAESDDSLPAPKRRRVTTSKKKEPVGKKTSEYAVGDKIFEGEYTAGTIVCAMDCTKNRTRKYFLLRNDKGLYTIYTAEKGMICQPTLSRMIPEEVVQRMFLQTFYGVDTPTPKVIKDLKGRKPVTL
jgi:hypothetical protein